MYVDPMKPDSREGNLPKWAQQMFGNLRRRTMEAEKQRDDARLATDPDGSDAVLDVHADVPIGLGKNRRVTFVFRSYESGGPLDWIEVYRNRDNPNQVEVSGSRTLTIRPHVTNVISVNVEPH
jgi:hypothetical protein